MKRFFPTSDHTGTDPALRVERYLEAPRHTRDQGGMPRLYHDHQPRIREKREECFSGELKRGRICSPRSTSPRDRRRSHYRNRPNRHQFSWRTLTSPVLYSSNRAGPIPHPSGDIRKRVDSSRPQSPPPRDFFPSAISLLPITPIFSNHHRAQDTVIRHPYQR